MKSVLKFLPIFCFLIIALLIFINRSQILVWVKGYIVFLEPSSFNISSYISEVKNYLGKEILTLTDIDDNSIPKVSVLESQDISYSENNTETYLLDSLVKGMVIIEPGLPKEDIVINSKTEFNNERRESIVKKITHSAISQRENVGTKIIETAKKEIADNFDKLISDFRTGAEVTESGAVISVTNQSLLDNLSIVDQKFFTEFKIVSEEDLIRIGYVEINMGNCSSTNFLSIYFNKTEGTYSFSGVKNFVDSLCLGRFIDINGVITGTCQDCTLFPVNKTYALRSDYEPSVTYLNSIPGDQYFLSAGVNDLLELNNALANSGFTLIINSGYRSYYTQAYLFEYYVETEMANGATRAQAEIIANSYSARPGHSEHQLGSAADVANAACGNFSEVCAANTSLWEWMLSNAYLYGFALSYPHDRVAETGYVFEPWHWRWIGKDLAAEFWEVRGNMSLNTFLFNKGRY